MNVCTVDSLSFQGKIRFKKLTPIIKDMPQTVVNDFCIDTKDIQKISGLNINAAAFARELGFSQNFKNFPAFKNSIGDLALIILNNGLKYRADLSKELVEETYNKILNTDEEIEL